MRLLNFLNWAIWELSRRASNQCFSQTPFKPFFHDNTQLSNWNWLIAIIFENHNLCRAYFLTRVNNNNYFLRYKICYPINYVYLHREITINNMTIKILFFKKVKDFVAKKFYIVIKNIINYPLYCINRLAILRGNKFFVGYFPPRLKFPLSRLGSLSVIGASVVLLI